MRTAQSPFPGEFPTVPNLDRLAPQTAYHNPASYVMIYNVYENLSGGRSLEINSGNKRFDPHMFLNGENMKMLK